MNSTFAEFAAAWTNTPRADRPFQAGASVAAGKVVSIGANQFLAKRDWLAGRTGPALVIFQNRIQLR